MQFHLWRTGGRWWKTQGEECAILSHTRLVRSWVAGHHPGELIARAAGKRSLLWFDYSSLYSVLRTSRTTSHNWGITALLLGNLQSSAVACSMRVIPLPLKSLTLRLLTANQTQTCLAYEK